MWRKSSYSNSSANCVEVTGWRKASHSFSNGNCVEVAGTGVGVAVRDSKDPAGPVLPVSETAWREFLDRLRGLG